MEANLFRTLATCGCLVASMVAGAASGDETASPAGAAGQPAAGHSYHGESFNEGPRQRAYLMSQTGSLAHTGIVNFPATTTSPEAQQFINQGVGQLHGFWYYEAERSFRQAAMLDSQCAIAYWGMALANTNNARRARGFLSEAVKRKSGISERERMYIDALEAFYDSESKGKDKERHEAYAGALERILYKFPDDLDARAWLGLQLWINRQHQSPITSHLAVDGLFQEVFAVQPAHPCHHYRIHLWDDGAERAQIAVNSAARCGQAAPGIAHMWHMSGHIFSDLKRYADAAWQQEASARVDHAYMLRDHILPDQIHNYAHNNEWLIRDLSHIGRVRQALALARNLVEIPRHPQYNTLSGGSAAYGRARLFEVLTRFELWDELISMCETPYLEPTDNPAEQVKRLRHLGAARLRREDVSQGLSLIGELQERLRKERYRLNLAEAGLPVPGGAGPGPVPQDTSAGNSGGEPRPEPVALATAEDDGRVKPIELAIDELKGHLAVAQGDYKAGLPLLNRAGGIDPVYLAKIEFLAGDREQSLKHAREAADQHKNEAQPLAELIGLLWQANEPKEAADRFAQLREISTHVDLDVPVFSRLAPIAASLSLPTDWRVMKPPPSDVGERPPLDSLGPFLWHPYEAPAWSVSDAHGARVSMMQYRGRPLVLIFYLGFQCLHCAEQLQAFAPLTKEFEDAGISLLALSTDDANGLAKSVENYKSGSFPFPLASDGGLEAFKAYRAYDDFEQRPLHATIFIDGEGLVRWQDIGFEPFRDARFVLNEASRLLSLSKSKLPAGQAVRSLPVATPAAP
jgi:peroxiredoxin